MQSIISSQELGCGPHRAFRPQPRLGRALRHRSREEAILQTSGNLWQPLKGSNSCI